MYYRTLKLSYILTCIKLPVIITDYQEGCLPSSALHVGDAVALLTTYSLDRWNRVIDCEIRTNQFLLLGKELRESI